MTPPDSGTDSGIVPKTDAGQYIAWSDFCGFVSQGISNAMYLHATQCGDALQPGDLPHIPETHGVALYGNVLSNYSCAPGSPLAKDLAQFGVAIDAGRILYDGANAYACYAAGRDGGSALIRNPKHRLANLYVDGGVPGPCGSVLTGTVAASGACQLNEECAGEDSYCRPAGSGSCGGTCQPRVPVGGVCDFNLDLCVPQANCETLPDGGPGCVQARALPGEACNPSVMPPANFLPCLEGYNCVNGALADGGRACEVPLGAGQSCHDLIGSTDCEPSLGCVGGPDAGAAVCQPRAPRGGACASDGTAGLAICDSCFTCVSADGGTPAANNPGHCSPPPSGGYIESRSHEGAGAAGATCSGDSNCDNYDYCDAGSCVAKSRTGETCGRTGGSGGSQQGNCLYVDNYCLTPSGPGDAGTCSTFPDAGEPCGSDGIHSQDCLGGLWCAPPPDGGATGSCQPLAADGAACGSGTNPPRCANGEACDKLPDGGGPVCTHNAGQPCVSACEANYFCGSLDGGSTVCLHWLSSGTPCGVDGGLGGSVCESRFCGANGLCQDICTARTTSSPQGVGPGLSINTPITSCYGCQRGGRDYAYYLFFALFLAPGLRRRGPKK